MQQNGSKYFVSRPPPHPTLGQHGRESFASRPPPHQHWGSKCQNTTFSEHNRVAY